MRNKTWNSATCFSFLLNSNHIFNWYTYCHHWHVPYCTQWWNVAQREREKKRDILSWAKTFQSRMKNTQKTTRKIKMWNNAGKVKLGENTTENETDSLLPPDPDFERLKTTIWAASAPAAEYTWLAKSQLFGTVLHLGDHPLPWLHVGRYLDGWGRAGGGAKEKRQGRRKVAFFFFFYSSFVFFCLFVC